MRDHSADHGAPQLRIGAATHAARLEAGAPGGWQAFAAAVLAGLDAELRRFAPDWLGHCKLLIETAGAVAYASLTEAGGEPGWSGDPGAAAGPADLTVYCAAYGLDDGQAQEAMAALLAAFPELA